MVKKLHLIPLETTDQSLVDDIYKIIVTDSNIYIMDSFKGRGIIIFDRQGNGHLGAVADYTLLITDKKFKIKNAAFYTLPLGKVLSGYDYLYFNNQSVMVTQPYADTIYQYTSATENLQAKYVLDYRRKKLPEKYLHCDTYAEFDKTVRNNDYYVH